MIKISSDEGKEDCLKLKTQGTQASLRATVIAVTILLLIILSIVFISRVTVNVLVFVLRVVCVQYEVLGPPKSAMPLVSDFSENDKIFRREKKYIE